ncbi:Protein CBR-SRT-12 [Caenorhabditis briggsae]|uniref:Protein CBR-SRT-12 n=2 Tax=Caenorhabditis briggsae TaxID=6238 RepID=A8WQD9_CAEBR|nr:Protein CBR-SRT-12 [Caenorhabditis briggsae]ULT87209.1 hypothetical protein L3Y34_006771 [Caenorhabditis briggsae]CAP22697.2 Protein CBR-SRT-12 [Caenorhabditis briggsae]
MSDLQMSMAYMLTHSFTLYPEIYKCPGNTSAMRTKRPILGTYFLASGLIFILLYTPCFIVMVRSKCRVPAFQVMLILAVFDLLSLSVNSVITGLLDIMGFSFSHFPVFIFCAGAIGKGSWMGGCVACILLAVDRCVEVNAKFRLGFLFKKKVFRVVMGLMVLYWVYSCGFTKPLLFKAEYSSWFFDPKIGKEPYLYHSIDHTINNLVVSLATTSLYIYLCYHLIYKIGYSTSMWLYRSKQQIIIQAVILCSFHAIAAYIYVYMQFFYSPPWLIIIGQLAWQWSNGCFCVAYLTLNQAIRNAVVRMLVPKKLRERFDLHIGIDEHLTSVKQITQINTVSICVKMNSLV